MPRIPIYTQQTDTPVGSPLRAQAVEMPDYLGRGVSALASGLGDMAESRFKVEMTRRREDEQLAKEAAEESKRQKALSDRLTVAEARAEFNVSLAQQLAAEPDAKKHPDIVAAFSAKFDGDRLASYDPDQRMLYQMAAVQDRDRNFINAINAKTRAMEQERGVQFNNLVHNEGVHLSTLGYDDLQSAGHDATKYFELAKALPGSPVEQENAARAAARKNALGAIERMIALDPRRAQQDIQNDYASWGQYLTLDDKNDIAKKAGTAVEQLNAIDRQAAKANDELAKKAVSDLDQRDAMRAPLSSEDIAGTMAVANSISDPLDREKAKAQVAAIQSSQMVRQWSLVRPTGALVSMKKEDIVKMFPGWETATAEQQNRMVATLKEEVARREKDPAACADDYLAVASKLGKAPTGDKYQQRLAAQSVLGVPGDKRRYLTQAEVDNHATAFTNSTAFSMEAGVKYFNDLQQAEGPYTAKVIRELADRSDSFPKGVSLLIDGKNNYINQTYLAYLLTPQKALDQEAGTKVKQAFDSSSKDLAPLYGSLDVLTPGGQKQYTEVTELMKKMVPTTYTMRGDNGPKELTAFLKKDYDFSPVGGGRFLRVPKSLGIPAATVDGTVKNKLDVLLKDRDIAVDYLTPGTSKEQYLKWSKAQVFAFAANDEYVVPCLLGPGGTIAPLEERKNGMRVPVKIALSDIKAEVMAEEEARRLKNEEARIGLIMY